MAQQIVCDGCGTACPDGGTCRGIYDLKHYCPDCDQKWQAMDREHVEAVAKVARDLEAKMEKSRRRHFPKGGAPDE